MLEAINGSAGHAAGHIAQGVEFPVGRSQVLRLAAQHDAVFLQLLPEFGFAQIDAIARDRFQLVDRAAAERQAAPRHLAHGQAGGGHQRRDDQAHFVAHAAAGMLVHDDGRDVVQIEHIAGVRHRQRQIGGFARGHAAKDTRPCTTPRPDNRECRRACSR